MMAKYSEQPNNNWKDLPVLIWLKPVLFFLLLLFFSRDCLAGLDSMVCNGNMDVIIQLLKY